MILRPRSILVSISAPVLIFLCYLTYLTVSLPNVEFLRRSNPEATSLMTEREAKARQAGRRPRRIQNWMTLDKVSEQLIQAVIIAEDGSFYIHHGFNFHEIRESIRKNLAKGGYVRGASTITQQLAKNLFLSTEKSIHRKIKEAILTRRLESTLKKRCHCFISERRPLDSMPRRGLSWRR